MTVRTKVQSNFHTMKPLFDTEDFAFISSDDNLLRVWCRGCDKEAAVVIHGPPVTLRALCDGCGKSHSFVIANARLVGKTAHAE